MTPTQALTLAREALVHHTEQTRPIQRTQDAIRAIDAALSAAPADEPVAPIADWEEIGTVLASVADNLGDMPISDEWAAKTAKRAWSLLERNNYFRAAQPVAGEPVGYVNASAIDWLRGPDRGRNAHIEVGIFKTPGEGCNAPIYTAARRPSGLTTMIQQLNPDDVKWIVNSLGELGVMIHGQAFFLYKGHSLVYENPSDETDGGPMHYRPVFKREFGECAYPINYKDPTLIGTVSLDDSDEWKPLPTPAPVEKAAPADAWQAAAEAWAKSLGTHLSPHDDPTEAIRALIERSVRLVAAQQAAQPVAGEPVAQETTYTPGEWFLAKTVDAMQAFYLARLPAIREAAHAHGYAIGLHGSTRRDLDLIAAPWRDGASDADTLAHAIAQAACGITRAVAYDWERKPAGRLATSIPICWTAWHGQPGAGHIDLSVITAAPAPVGLVPLTLDQIGEMEWGAACIGLGWDVRVSAVRAVERAHKIEGA